MPDKIYLVSIYSRYNKTITYHLKRVIKNIFIIEKIIDLDYEDKNKKTLY